MAVITIEAVAVEQLVTATSGRADENARCIMERLSLGGMRHSFHFLWPSIGSLFDGRLAIAGLIRLL
jgi:hypothetical protein